MGSDDEPTELASWRSMVRSQLSQLPSDYASSGPMAPAIRRVFHEELAAALEPRLNAHVKSLPQDAPDDKKALASWLNHELHYVQGLSLRDPRSGNPAILVTDFRYSNDPNSIRFRLEVQKPDGKRTRSYGSPTLPELRLMADPPRNEALSRWGKSPRRGGMDR